MICILLSVFAFLPENNGNLPNIAPEIPNFGRTSAVVALYIEKYSLSQIPVSRYRDGKR